MTTITHCSAALAALLATSLPALAQDELVTSPEFEDGTMHTMDGAEDGDDMAGNGFVTFMFEEREVRLPLGLAAQVCGVSASELAQGDRGEIECDIDDDEAARLNFPGFTGEDGDDSDGDMTDGDERTEEEREAREQDRDERAEDREEDRNNREQERENEREADDDKERDDEEQNNEDEEQDHEGDHSDE